MDSEDVARAVHTIEGLVDQLFREAELRLVWEEQDSLTEIYSKIGHLLKSRPKVRHVA